MTEIE